MPRNDTPALKLTRQFREAGITSAMAATPDTVILHLDYRESTAALAALTARLDRLARIGTREESAASDQETEDHE